MPAGDGQDVSRGADRGEGSRTARFECGVQVEPAGRQCIVIGILTSRRPLVYHPRAVTKTNRGGSDEQTLVSHDHFRAVDFSHRRERRIDNAGSGDRRARLCRSDPSGTPTLSPVHTLLLVIAWTLLVAAGFFQFRLSRWARALYLGTLIAQLADLALFYMMLNMINLDLSIFAVLGLLLYSQYLYRGGFLR